MLTQNPTAVAGPATGRGERTIIGVFFSRAYYDEPPAVKARRDTSRRATGDHAIRARFIKNGDQFLRPPLKLPGNTIPS